jgi:hypothetical protein
LVSIPYFACLPQAGSSYLAFVSTLFHVALRGGQAQPACGGQAECISTYLHFISHFDILQSALDIRHWYQFRTSPACRGGYFSVYFQKIKSLIFFINKNLNYIY